MIESVRRETARPQPSELVSLVERMGALGLVRLGLVALGLGLAVVEPSVVWGSVGELIVPSAAYLLLLLTPWAIERRSRASAQRIVGGTLLADGVYLAWMIYASGGTESPLRTLVLVHVVAVTLLASSRTGLKVAAWHSLLFVALMFAQSAELLQVRENDPGVLPGLGSAFPIVAFVQLGALWAVTLATAACSRVNERELRAQKVDLDELSTLTRELDAGRDAAEMPAVVLEVMCRVFGFTRGVVLASPAGELEVMAGRGIGENTDIGPGLDDALNRAWRERKTQLVRTLDPHRDSRLAGLMPEASNVLVVPLMVDHSYRLGAIVLERAGRRSHIKRWIVGMVEQFAAQAALSLHNVWLREQLRDQLEENRDLQRQLVAHNLELELRVQERTRDLSATLESLREVDEQRRRLLVRLVHAEEEERRRIAADIHDDPIQKLVAANMRLQLLRRPLAETEHVDELDKMIDVLRSSIRSLRHLIFELRPTALDEAGLAAAIEEYLESMEGDYQHRVVDRLEHEAPEELRVTLYRMTQEALANVHKHARASSVEVTVEDRNGGFLVTIADDGVGFTIPDDMRSERGHLGLTALRERAEMAGGTCDIRSLPGQGTTVELWVPAGASADAGVASLDRRGEMVISLAREQDRSSA